MRERGGGKEREGGYTSNGRVRREMEGEEDRGAGVRGLGMG